MIKKLKSILSLTFSIILAASFIHAADSHVQTNSLMPVPKKLEYQTGKFRLTKDFTLSVNTPKDGRLAEYAARILKRLEGRTVLDFPTGFASEADSNLTIAAEYVGKEYPALGDNESYTLEVKPTGIRLSSKSDVGAMRGLETLIQLLASDEEGFFFPAVKIEDEPRFPWRGLMIDSARHFQPLHVMKRNIDGLAAVKMNVLHWHLTEDQGFRVESKKFPKLHGMGSDGDFYTQDEIRDVIKYAADRGIRVVPEFDMPGHATSWLVGHPELGSQPGPYKIERNPGIFDPTLDPTKGSTYDFLEVFFKEMAGLFPDEYIHIGGDENEGKHWDKNEKIQAFMKKNGIKDNHELQTHFNKRIAVFLRKEGKKMMGWDEIFQDDLPKDVVIHSWRGQKALADAARKGYTGVLSNGYYIDLMYPASDHYKNDPIPADSDLTAEEKKRVLGGEATMWSEWVSPETIDSRIWPRTAAIAERLWSPGDVTNEVDMYRRLAHISDQLEELGLTHKRNRMVILRRLLRSDNIANLETLLEFVEPVKGYQRYQQRPQTMLSPLTGLIDAAGADATGAREFSYFVDKIKSDGFDADRLKNLEKLFSMWSRVGGDLEKEMATAPGLFEAKDLASNMKRLGELGTDLVRIQREDPTPTPEWRDKTLDELKEIAKPKGALEFAMIKSMEELISLSIK